MQYRKIPGLNKSAARIVQGSTMIGSDLDEAKSFALLDQVYELGCNTLDTAHVYSGGDSERIIGRWMHSRGLRDEIVLITKGAAHSQDRRRMTPFDVTSDLYDSLARLKTDHIDLFLLHRDDPDLPFESIIHTLNEHQQAGRILAFGASNWSHQRIESANAYARSNGLNPFMASSPQYSMVESLGEPWPLCLSISGASGADARAWYEKTQMPVFAWSPLASGFFSGRFRRDNLHTFGNAEWDRVCIQTYASDENFQRLDRASVLGAEKGLSAAQVAIAYILNQSMNVFAVAGPSRIENFREIVKAGEIQLTPQEMAWLDLKSDTH